MTPGIRSEANVSGEDTVPSYACSVGAAGRDDLMEKNKNTPLISDDLKPPYEDGNSRSGSEPMGAIRAEADPSRSRSGVPSAPEM